jgi:hypothetical protein
VYDQPALAADQTLDGDGVPRPATTLRAVPPV